MKYEMTMPKPGLRTPEPPELSLLSQFDDLIRNSNSLNRGEEKEFLTFVRSSGLLVGGLENTKELVQRLELEKGKLEKENTGI